VTAGFVPGPFFEPKIAPATRSFRGVQKLVLGVRAGVLKIWNLPFIRREPAALGAKRVRAALVVERERLPEYDAIRRILAGDPIFARAFLSRFEASDLRRTGKAPALSGFNIMAASDRGATKLKSDETVALSEAVGKPLTPTELAARFPNLEVIELLGQGGMGMVYKGRQPFLDRVVAIKVVRPELQADDAFQERFLREARTLAKLRHPFIVTVFDVYKADDLYCLVMEYVEGASVRQLLEKGSVTQHMAPEQLSMPQAVDHRADIYSTGVVFYEMLARELPGPDRVPPSCKAGTDPRLDPIVLRATEHERERRYQAARLMHHDIITVSRTPESTILLEQHIPAPPDQVFAAWIDTRQLAGWFAPSDEFGPTMAEVDPQVGGTYRFGMLPPGQSDRRFVSGQYCQVAEPRTLSFTWAWEPHKPGWNETQVTLDFQPNGDGTDLRLTHERFRHEGDRNDHTQGWRGCLGRLCRKFGG
jgi:uncharacterized protein YndB with AHSA1/START domain